MTNQLEALREEAAQIIGLLTATGNTGLVLDKTADFFDDMFRQLEASPLAVKLPPSFDYEHDDLVAVIPVMEAGKVKAALRAAGITVQGDE